MPQFPLRPAQTRHSTSQNPPENTSPLPQASPQAPSQPTPLSIRTKNRRRRYLALHPEYFSDPALELADPLLYDRLIRRFQSAQEREAEGRSRGDSKVLEADLERSEATIAALQKPELLESPLIYVRGRDGRIIGVEVGDEEEDGMRSREEGVERWRDIMGRRFMRGGDGEFDYEGVDGNEEYDDRGEEEREILEKWMDEGTEEFVGDGSPKGQTGVQDF